MDGIEMLPTVNGDISFEYTGLDMSMVFEACDGDRLVFLRVDGRWRFRGPFASGHTIASRIFKYRENPSQQEMEWMGDFVETVGRLLDVAEYAIKKGIEYRAKKIEDRQNALSQTKDYIEQSFSMPKTFVYLMKHTNGLTKIGKSKNPKARERTLQAEDPRLNMVFCAEAENYIETRLHKIFDSVRVRGEWFALNDHHIDWIAAVLKGYAVKERARQVQEEKEIEAIRKLPDSYWERS